jgi:protein involved in polysaccharide export with SLBB domain
VILLIFCEISFSQDDDKLIFGPNANKVSAALFDLSDPTGVNIEVNVWGYVRFPGRYRIPLSTTFLDVITYAGGPISDSKLDDMRIVRGNDSIGGKPYIIKLNYDDFLWADQIGKAKKINPVLQAGDIILIREQKRYTARDDINLLLPIITTVVTLANFILLVFVYKQ